MHIGAIVCFIWTDRVTKMTTGTTNHQTAKFGELTHVDEWCYLGSVSHVSYPNGWSASAPQFCSSRLFIFSPFDIELPILAWWHMGRWLFRGQWRRLHIASCGVRFKGNGSSLDIAPFTILDSGALQPQKWLLTGID